MAHVEPMDLDCIDNDFDNKENTYQPNNAAPRVSTEKGYEELDVSDLNMKLRYSVTPAASPMSKSYTANCTDNRNITSVEDVLNANNANLTRSFNSTFTNSDSILKSPKSLPLQSIPSDNFTEFNRNSSIRRSLDASKNNVTVTITTLQDIEDNLSLPSTSSSLTHTPEATTPTKEIPKQDGGSPIMRGLKSVLSMFRTSQSPIPPVDDRDLVKKDVNVTQPQMEETSKQTVLASTPIRSKNSPPKGGSPLKESVVFKEDLERELQWKDDSTIIFKEEKIPIHKLFLPSLPVEVKSVPNDNMNNTVEYMDISLNESVLNDQGKNATINHEPACPESDSEFQDCETTFTRTDQEVGQLITANIINGPEITQENIDMSIVENEYHEVNDHKPVVLDSGENIIENAAIQNVVENIIEKDTQEGQKESNPEEMQEDLSSTDKVTDVILPDVVENTLNKSVNELNGKQEVSLQEPNNTTNDAGNPEAINTQMTYQADEVGNDKDPSICNNTQVVNITEDAINITSNAEGNTNNNSSTTYIEEKPLNEVGLETPLQVKTIEIENEVAVTIMQDQVVHELESKEISIVKDNIEEIESDILNVDKSEQEVVESMSIMNSQSLEESQCNIKLVYDEICDTSLKPLDVTNDVTINHNENKSDSMITVKNEPNIEAAHIMCNENEINVDHNENMANVTEITENNVKQNQFHEICQDKFNDTELIPPETLQPILSNNENGNNIENSVGSHAEINMPPSEIPLPSENEEHIAIDCNINFVKDTEEIVSESILQETISQDKDTRSESNDESQNVAIVASNEVVHCENQQIALVDDNKNSSNDLAYDIETDATLDKHDNNEEIEQITVQDEKDTEIHNDQNDKIISENKTSEQVKNINEMEEQNKCDIEVENALSKNIGAAASENIEKEVNKESDIHNTVAMSSDTPNKDGIVPTTNNYASESENGMDIDININPFATKSRVLTTPPSSPKIVSKGYNFDFDEIDDPFATKTKIRESPTPISPPRNTFKPINNPVERKPLNINRKPIQNRRKSQPAPRTEPTPKNRLNSTFDSSTFTKKSLDKMKTEEFKFDETNSEVEKPDQIVINQVNNESKNITCTNNDEICTVKENIQNEIEENDKFDSEDTSASNINIEPSRKNVFNIPEIDDKNFNPFASRSKICSSPIPENNSTIQDNSYNINICDTTVNIDKTKNENIVVTNIEKENTSDISNNTVSSKQADDKNETIKEVNTEDEDTIEGPILEPEDFVNFDTDTDILPTLEKDDMIGFDDFPMQPNNEENGDNAEIFIDAEAFEFLLNQNKSNVVADSGKESLFLKFDPLFAKRVSSDGILAALNKPPKRVSTPKKAQITKPELQPDLFNAGPSSSKPVAPHYPDDVNVTKPTMIVNPAVNSIPSPRKASTPPKINRQSLTFTSPAMAVIDRLLSLSGNSSFVNHDTTVPHVSTDQHQTDLALTQLREMLAEKEIHVQTLRSEREELKDRLAAMETQVKSLETESEDRLRKITELNQRLTEKTKENKTMAVVVEEYERTIASLVAELEQDKRRNAEERSRLIRDRDEQTAHLASMEVSFSDLHSKYEKSKQIIFSLKANEDTYKKSIKEFEENLIKMQNNYELLKQHATSKLNHANSELEKMNRAHEAEVLKLNAMIKRKDLHITSLEETLAQKTKANEELTAICDELINKVG